MITQDRWRLAQEYERSFWQNQARQIAAGVVGQMSWYSWKAKLMEEHLSEFLRPQMKDTAVVLEVGSGPVGIASFLPWGERYAVDPLEEYYRSEQALCQLRDKAVTYSTGSGERLLFESNTFSLVVLDNVLDHVHQASEVLHEIGRVMRPDGLLYFAMNIHTTWGAFLHRILSRLKIDRGHPYTFTAASIRAFLTVHGFSVQKEFINDYRKAKEQDLKSVALKDKLKAYAGLSEFIYYAVCHKQIATASHKT
jgi:ubiquinone/menaquinone biosynthesis C-methylase UbiE